MIAALPRSNGTRPGESLKDSATNTGSPAATGGLAAARLFRPVATALGSQHGGPGTREFIRVLRLLESFTLAQLADAVNYALDIDVIDPDSIRVIVEYRSQEPVELFSLDWRPQLAAVRVETTDVSAYQALLTEDR